MELTPESVDVFLLVIDTSKFHQVIACSRVSTIGANKEIKMNFLLRVTLVVACRCRWLTSVLGVIRFRSSETVLKPGCVLLEVGTCEFMVEEEGYVRHCFERVKKALIQTGAVNSVD